jgi:fatty-acyl-CoA synthase
MIGVETKGDAMAALTGQMMQMPLMISSLIVHAARHAADTEIVSKRVEGDLHRYTWAAAEKRSRQVAQALARLGCRPGERVGTLAWNGYRHLEIYYGSSGSQLVCHTINPRLFPEQIAWIVNDAEDKVLCFDLTFAPLVEKLHGQLTTVKHFVLMTARAHMPKESAIPNLRSYEDLIEEEDGVYSWPQFDENTASSICYTSGTTGHPKGAVYSHRSTLLHAYGSALPDGMGCSGQDVILPVVPMFHVNAWGLPYSSALVGAKLVMPGPHLDGKSLYELFEGEKVTFSAGVPTVWLGLITYLKQNDLKFSTFKRTVIGVPAGDDAHAGAGLRRRGAPRLGHDRDVAARHGGQAEVQTRRPRRSGPVRGAREARQGALRRRPRDHRRRRPAAAVGRQERGQPRRARAVDHPELLQGRRVAAGRDRRPAVVPDRRRGDDRP